MSTQADDYRHCSPIYYPGFSSLHPSPLPVQNNKHISLSLGISATLSCYEEILLRYGIRAQLPKYLKHTKMKNFVKDAFWWMFLEHFVSVDLELLLQQVKGNTLVSDEDMKAFQFDTVVPTHLQADSFSPDAGSQEQREMLRSAGVDEDLIPTLPRMRPDASIGAPTRHRLRDAAKKAPAHLIRGQTIANRSVQDIALVGSPRCASALSLADSIESRPQTPVRSQRNRHHHHPSTTEGEDPSLSLPPNSIHRNEVVSPTSDDDRFDEGDDGDDSDVSSNASVTSAMRITAFSNSRVQLNKLPLQVRLQISAKEQHQLFTRMAMNYGSMCTQTLGMNVGMKDAITRLLPEILSQLVFYLFTKAIPYATKLLDIPFQISLGQKFSFWLGGVERIYNVRAWGIHAFLDPVKRTRKQSRAGSVRRSQSPGSSLKHSTRGVDRSNSGSGSRSSSHTAAGAQHSPSIPPPPTAPRRILSFVMTPRNVETRSDSDTGGLLPRLQTDASAAHEQTTAETPERIPAPPIGRPASRGLPSTASFVIGSARSSDAPSRAPTNTARSSSTTSRGTSDAPPPVRKSDWGSAQKLRSDASPALLFVVGDNNTSNSPEGVSSPLRSVKSMRRPGGGSNPSSRPHRPNGFSEFGTLVPDDPVAKKKEAQLKQDLDAMKAELNKFKSMHTFAQFHYSGHVTRQVPTFRDADAEVDTASGKLAGVEERLPARIAQAFVIGPKKRNVQVIKKDLESKFLTNQPWYASKHQRTFIKDTAASATKFATNNWSPLLHRFMLSNGEENLRPVETMNWTV
jgi:hypothetical protein